MYLNSCIDEAMVIMMMGERFMLRMMGVQARRWGSLWIIFAGGAGVVSERYHHRRRTVLGIDNRERKLTWPEHV
jgi:hypothetical protein